MTITLTIYSIIAYLVLVLAIDSNKRMSEKEKFTTIAFLSLFALLALSAVSLTDITIGGF